MILLVFLSAKNAAKKHKKAIRQVSRMALRIAWGDYFVEQITEEVGGLINTCQLAITVLRCTERGSHGLYIDRLCT